MCSAGLLNAGASETGAMIWTDGSVDAHDTPWIVLVVGLPAASRIVTLMLNGAPPGQVTATHVSVLMAGTAAVPTHEADPPRATHRLLTAAPSDAGRPAASADV